MTPCTLYVRLCDLIVQSHCTEMHYSNDYINKSCEEDNSIINHSTESAAHTQLHTKAKTPSTEHTIELATNESTSSLSSSHVLSTLLQPSACCGSPTNNTDNNNHNKINQDEQYSISSNGDIKNQNREHMMSEEEEEFDVNGLYVILRHGDQVHRSSELTSEDETTASAAASIILMSTATEEEDEILAKSSWTYTGHHEEWTTSHTNTECRKYNGEKVKSNHMHCDKGEYDVKKAMNEVKNKKDEETNTRRKRRRGEGVKWMYEWNELFVFATKALPNASHVPLTQNTLESSAPMNTTVPSNIIYNKQNNIIYSNTSCEGKMYEDKYNIHVNLASPELRTHSVLSNAFYNLQETLPHQNEEQYCQEILELTTDDSHGTWPHELFDEMVIELWLDDANESLCLARGELDMNELYQQVYCSNNNSNNEKNNSYMHSNGCNQSDLLNSHAVLETQVQDKATSIRESHKRRRRNSESNISNNFILSNEDDKYNSSTGEQGEVKRTSNTKPWESESSSKLPLCEDDHVIDVVVPLTSNMHVALSVKLRMQCVGLHRLLQYEHHKEMEERNKVKAHELTQASSLLALPTNTTNTGVSSSSSTHPLFPSIYNNNNIAASSTVPQPSFISGAQCVAIDQTNFNYNSVNNYVYNNINNNTISCNNNYVNCYAPSAPISTPSPPSLIASPLPQPPIMQNNTLLHPNNYFSYYPPSTTLPSSLSSLATPSNYQLQQEQCSSTVNGTIEQVQPHNTMLAANTNNNLQQYMYSNNNSNTNNYAVNNTNYNNYYTNCINYNITDTTNSTVNADLLPSHSSPSVLMQQTMPWGARYAYNNNINNNNINNNNNNNNNKQFASMPNAHYTNNISSYMPQQQQKHE